MTKRAAIYVRVSTDKQTIENQLRELHPRLPALGPAYAGVAVLLHDLPPTALGNPVQFSELIFNGLLVSRYTDVNRGSFGHPTLRYARTSYLGTYAIIKCLSHGALWKYASLKRLSFFGSCFEGFSA